MKKIMFLGLCALFAFANTIKDSDLDGVPDNLDICPNTPFLETVNKNGCSAEQLKKIKSKENNIKFNISAGYEYDNYKDSKSSQLVFSTLSAYKNNFKLSLYYSMLNDGYTSGYKSNDLITSLYYYNYSITNTSLKLGVKAYLPTYFNDKTDYAFLIQGIYFFNKFDIGLSEKHKIYGENDENHKDTIMTFIDFYYKNLTISPYIYTENSPYDSSTWYKYAGLTFFYQANKQLGFMLDSSLDLEENENYTIDGSISYSF